MTNDKWYQIGDKYQKLYKLTCEPINELHLVSNIDEAKFMMLWYSHSVYLEFENLKHLNENSMGDVNSI